MASKFSVADYTAALLALLPRGRVWSRDPDSVQARAFAGMAPTFQRNDEAAINLLVDAFPATATDLLVEWEETLGLPDPCAGPAPTLQQRRAQVIARLVGPGGQSIPFFIAYAEALGYTVTTTEYSPFRVGQQGMGDPVANQDWAHVWAVNAPLNTVTPFRVGVSAMGEPLNAWGNDVLECEMNERAPAHTILQFHFS